MFKSVILPTVSVCSNLHVTFLFRDLKHGPVSFMMPPPVIGINFLSVTIEPAQTNSIATYTFKIQITSFMYVHVYSNT